MAPPLFLFRKIRKLYRFISVCSAIIENHQNTRDGDGCLDLYFTIFYDFKDAPSGISMACLPSLLLQLGVGVTILTVAWDVSS